MTEPDVALTDYAVALEGILFLALIRRKTCRRPGMRSWMMVFFASVSAASFCGGTYHGFFLDRRFLGEAILWPTTLIAMGLTALSTWIIGAGLLFSKRLARWILIAASVQFVVSSAIVLFLTRTFWFAVFNDLPGVVFLLVALVIAYFRDRQSDLLLAAVGAVLTLLGLGLQQLRIGVHPLYFNHNALYHVLQAVALVLFFRGSRSIIGEQQPGTIVHQSG